MSTIYYLKLIIHFKDKVGLDKDNTQYHVSTNFQYPWLNIHKSAELATKKPCNETNSLKVTLF